MNRELADWVIWGKIREWYRPRFWDISNYQLKKIAWASVEKVWWLGLKLTSKYTCEVHVLSVLQQLPYTPVGFDRKVQCYQYFHLQSLCIAMWLCAIMLQIVYIFVMVYCTGWRSVIETISCLLMVLYTITLKSETGAVWLYWLHTGFNTNHWVVYCIGKQWALSIAIWPIPTIDSVIGYSCV